MMFILTFKILLDVKQLNKLGKIAFYLFIIFVVFLGFEGSDTVGEKIYEALINYGFCTCLLFGLFLFISWLA